MAVFAGDHGVADLSAAPATTAAMVANSAAGGAAINQVCKTFDLSLRVFELALEHPTGDIAREPALDEKGCAATMAFGMEALAARPDLLCLGEFGVGGDIAASAIYHALYGGKPEDWVVRGAGPDDALLAHKAELVRAAIATHREHLGDPFEVLRRLGGREIAAMVGAILAARMQRTPVLLDGFVACASCGGAPRARSRFARPLCRRARRPRARARRGATAPWQSAIARSWRSARRRRRRGAGGGNRQGRRRLPQRRDEGLAEAAILA